MRKIMSYFFNSYDNQIFKICACKTLLLNYCYFVYFHNKFIVLRQNMAQWTFARYIYILLRIFEVIKYTFHEDSFQNSLYFEWIPITAMVLFINSIWLMQSVPLWYLLNQWISSIHLRHFFNFWKENSSTLRMSPSLSCFLWFQISLYGCVIVTAQRVYQAYTTSDSY